MNSMVLAIATRRWEGWERCVKTWHDTAARKHMEFVVVDCNVMDAYQMAYEGTVEPIIGYLHDDVEIFEKGWDERVLKQFDDPTVGLVGFGGALGHGAPHLYTTPYHLPNLARQQFLSNMRSAEKHGGRFDGERDVAVLDAFALFVRRPILDEWGGWPQGKAVGYYMLAENLCCEVRRQGFRIRLVGVDCEHLGGRTSTIHPVSDDYETEHRYFYEHNRDVMPYKVKE
jgi:hypothetical protein